MGGINLSGMRFDNCSAIRSSQEILQSWRKETGNLYECLRIQHQKMGYEVLNEPVHIPALHACDSFVLQIVSMLLIFHMV
jgi:hypothetical protein